jgi:hypothetical protein
VNDEGDDDSDGDDGDERDKDAKCTLHYKMQVIGEKQKI